MLEVERLESGYGESTILRNISLKVEPGKVVCIMGRNGVGKTTLMKTIMGAIKCTQGRIRFKGEEITSRPPEFRAKSGIGYVPQGREIFAQLSVYENLLLGLEAGGKKLTTIPPEAMERFPVLETMFQRQGGDLSGGQQQQLAFARALSSSPQLLLLDEPTEGIQPSIVEDIQDVICSIKDKGTTAILLVEQSVEFVLNVADYFYVIEKGVIVAEGEADKLDEEAVKTYLVV